MAVNKTPQSQNKKAENVQTRMISVHPLWYSFIKYCETLKYGEIERVKIQDGLPILAEEVKKKVKFT